MNQQGSALWDAQVAVYRQLNEDAVLRVLCPGGVWDGTPPQDRKIEMPYTLIDAWTENNEDQLSRVSRDCTFLIRIVSNYQGSKQVKQIGDRIAWLLSRRTELVVDGWGITYLAFEEGNTFLDGELRQAANRYRIKLVAKLQGS